MSNQSIQRDSNIHGSYDLCLWPLCFLSFCTNLFNWIAKREQKCIFFCCYLTEQMSNSTSRNKGEYKQNYE